MRVVNLDDDIMAKAFQLCCEEISHNEIIDALKFGDDVKKQICTLKMLKIENVEEARALVSNLIEQDGVVREAVALKLNEFICLPNSCQILLNEEFYPFYAKGIVDVNPNICRSVIEFLSYLPNRKLVFSMISATAKDLLIDIQNRPAASNHIITKKIFKLYWCLEAVGNLSDEAIDAEVLSEIFDAALELNDYTILEKIAKIVTKSDFLGAKFDNYAKILREHENFYVRSCFSS